MQSTCFGTISKESSNSISLQRNGSVNNFMNNSIALFIFIVMLVSVEKSLYIIILVNVYYV